jgi:amino acid transporter
MKVSKIGKAVYKGAATYGRITAILSLVLAIILGIVLFGIGWYLINKPADKKVTAFVSDVKDASYCKNGNNKFTGYCVSFTLDDIGKTKTEYVQTNSILNVGDKVTLYESDDETFSLKNNNYKAFGYLLFVVGLIIVAFAGLQFYFTQKSKTYAAFQGAQQVVNWVR